MGELKSSGDITNSLLKALTARLSSSEQEALETNLIRGVIEKFTKDGITDFSKVSDTLKNAPFESKRAVEIMGELNKKAPILNNTSSLLEKLTAINPKAKELQQGIGHSVTGALMTMKRNLAIERLKSLLPVLGNDASLKNHIRNAINNAGDLKSVINNLEKIEIKDAPENSTKLLEAFKNEVKALREETQTGEIKGDGFITKESPAPKSDLNVKMDLAPNIRDLSKITTEEISADLDYLASKHPEMFSKPSDVFRLIKEIKNEPTHFFNNYRLDYALVAKRLNDKKIGKLAINKESGEVKHATKVKEKDLKRLDKVSRENSKDAGIIQTFIQPGSKSNSELGLPNEIIPKQTQELDKTFKNQKDKNTKTINASPHIASGLLGGTANGADENGNVSPEEFAKGFIYALFGSKFSASAVKRISPELYNSILGLGKKMPQMAKDNPKLLTKIYGSAKSNSINSFAGEKALNASANKLSKAKAMLEKGEDEVKIWQSTGWYKDKDGAWKFEIDDSPAKIKNQNADKLGDLLEHKELFKAYPELRDIKIKKIGDDIPDGAALSAKNTAQKEKRGIYNVAYNDKNSTQIKQDLDNINDAIKYERGNIGKGAKHISIRHLDDENKAGFVTKEELLNLGENVRNFIKEHKEPFVNKKNARIYEWEDHKGVRFKLVVSNKNGEGRGLPLGKSQDVSSITNDLRPATKKGLSPSGNLDDIITFYSDRNLKEPMKFENLKLKLLDAIDTSSGQGRLS